MNRDIDGSFFFISSENMTRDKQQEFFQENFAEVFRAYFIYAGFPFAQEYKTWNSYTPTYQNGKLVTEILINPDYDTLEKQQQFLQENFVEVFRFYFIFFGIPFATILPYGSTVPETIIIPEAEPEAEPESELTEPKADLAVKDSASYYGSDNQLVSIDSDNSGNITSTGYNNVDWRRIFEVTTDINQSQTIQNLQAGTPLYVTKNGVKTIYYPNWWME